MKHMGGVHWILNCFVCLFFLSFSSCHFIGTVDGAISKKWFLFPIVQMCVCVCVYFNQSTLASFSQQNIVQHDVQFIPILNQRLRFLFPDFFFFIIEQQHNIDIIIIIRIRFSCRLCWRHEFEKETKNKEKSRRCRLVWQCVDASTLTLSHTITDYTDGLWTSHRIFYWLSDRPFFFFISGFSPSFVLL